MSELNNSANNINQNETVKTPRKGIQGIRDKFAFYKMAMFFAYGYISLIQTMIIFLGITPQAIENLNSFILVIGLKYQFPVELSSFATILLIIGLFIFGVLAMLHFGLYKREAEVASQQNPAMFLLYQQNKEIIDLLKQINERIK